MKWFVVSLVSVIDSESSAQIEFPVNEDFYLFCASSEGELQEKISRQMDLINKSGEGYHLEGRAAKLRCLGARKIKSIYNNPPSELDGDPPGDGTELSSSFMSVRSLFEAEMLAKGKTVLVRYIDDDEDENGGSCFSG